ncbi:hypothetical protein SFR_6952 (plasmid) [Streptomyces sp. FR-008]|nr:hypothetical protein SFR_6952 [Streptomyces sp. FR-008]
MGSSAPVMTFSPGRKRYRTCQHLGADTRDALYELLVPQ